MRGPVTGVLKFPGDWPGYFFQGDDALGIASLCYHVAEKGSEEEKNALLLMIARKLEACRVTEK